MRLQFSSKLVHLAGHKNVASDAFNTSSSLTVEESAMVEVFVSEDITPGTYPLQHKRITEY